MNAKIVVVEDDPIQLLDITSVLGSAGYDVYEAVNGNKALELVEKVHPDLVLLDVKLPDADGVEISKSIKSHKEFQDIFVVLISGAHTSSESQSLGLEAGADGYLVKPIPKRELLARIESILRIKELKNTYRTVFENTGTATIIVENNRVISLANNEFTKLTGYSKDEVEGKKIFTDLVIEEDQKMVKEYHNMRRKNPELAPRNYELRLKDKSGQVKDIYLTAGRIMGTDRSLLSLLDMTERKKEEKAFFRESEINKDLAKLSSKLLKSVPIEDISELVLEYAQGLTKSDFGFVGFIDPDTGYLISPTMTRNVWTECHVEDKSIIFEKFGGMWGWVLNNKESLLTNNPKDDSRSTGTPTGHVEIKTFLAVPAMADNKLVGLISLANAEKYDDDDLDVVQRLSDLYAIAINRKHSDDILRKSEEKYRNIVAKFLKVSNEIIIEISKK